MARPFPLPDDGNAWWTLIASLFGGAWMTFGLQGHAGAVGLGTAALSLFLASEWMSHLSGRSRQGHVPHAAWAQPIGLALLSAALWGCWSLYHALPPSSQPLWQSLGAAMFCGLALILILRMEWVPLDERLVFLTHLLVTTPALLFGFLQWGLGGARAFAVWLPLAAYFPAQALFSVFWLKGPNAPTWARSLLALPILAGIVALSLVQAWPLALFLALALSRFVHLLNRRQEDRPAHLPALQAIQRLGRELHLWHAIFCVAWFLFG